MPVIVIIYKKFLVKTIKKINSKKCQTYKNKKHMNKKITKIKKCVAVLLCTIFAILAIDWIFTLLAYFFRNPYRGAFFPEIWSITSLLYEWLPIQTFTRGVFWLVAGVITVFLPVIIFLLSLWWYHKLKENKWGSLPHFSLA